MKIKFSSLGWVMLILPVISIGLVLQAIPLYAAHSFADTRNVGSFNALSVAGSFDVEVTLGNTESVRLEGDPDVLKDIETVVKNGTLHIRTKKGIKINWPKSGKVKAYVSAKSLSAIGQSGSGSILVAGTLSGDKLDLSLSGSGKMNIRTSVNTANVSVSGSGKIDVAGSAKEVNASVSGSGRVNGTDWKSNTANVSVSGSGQIRIHAEEKINANLAGSGRILYSGDPETVIKKSGSGSISKV